MVKRKTKGSSKRKVLHLKLHSGTRRSQLGGIFIASPKIRKRHRRRRRRRRI
jgi:hypothetical protein